MRAARKLAEARTRASGTPRAMRPRMQRAGRAARLEGVTSASHLRHVRPPRPLRFPVEEPWEEKMSESDRHRRVRGLVTSLIEVAVGPGHAVASDLFVYFDAGDDRRNLAPDAFLKLGGVTPADDAWMAWELGVPELCVEIHSPSDSPEKLSFAKKLRHYRALGTRELVTFHPRAKPGSRLRVWDRIDQDLVQRVVEHERTPCVTLGLYWVLAPALLDGVEVGLRLARDAEGRELVPSPAETLRAAEEARDAAERARARAEEERDAAQRRIAELEAELKKRGG
jgi:Uma2 family endonuclease